MKNTILLSCSILCTIGLLSSQAHAGRVNKRQHLQRGRIAQGVKSGELNKAEAHQLRKEEQRVRHLEHKVKADGNVTAKEHLKLEAAQDKVSKDIHEQKHD